MGSDDSPLPSFLSNPQRVDTDAPVANASSGVGIGTRVLGLGWGWGCSGWFLRGGESSSALKALIWIPQGIPQTPFSSISSTTPSGNRLPAWTPCFTLSFTLPDGVSSSASNVSLISLSSHGPTSPFSSRGHSSLPGLSACITPSRISVWVPQVWVHLATIWSTECVSQVYV